MTLFKGWHSVGIAAGHITQLPNLYLRWQHHQETLNPPLRDKNRGSLCLETGIISKPGSLSTAGMRNYHHGEVDFSSEHPKMISSMALKMVYRSHEYSTYIMTPHGRVTPCECPGMKSSTRELLNRLPVSVSTGTEPAGRASRCAPA